LSLDSFLRSSHLRGGALESGGVAIVETNTPEGSMRSTHVWYVEPRGALWLEAGTPENGWFLDVQSDPILTIEIEGHSRRYRARPIDGPSGHEQIRSVMREKYGLRDQWVALLFDTTRSIAVELIRVPES
jgi:hypothetical protein